MIPAGTRIAVHYNFDNGRLSVRQILPSGALKALLATVDDIVLEDAEFTCNRARWRRWKDGLTRKVRQFSEVRGIHKPTATPKATSDRWDEIMLNPRRSPEFRLAGTGEVVKRAKKVRITGREMRALKPTH